MASLFDLLRDTMPIAAAEFASVWHGTDFDDVDVSDVLPFLRYLEPDESYTAITPPIKEVDHKNNKLGPLQRLWAWKHDAADPATVSDIWCRVRDAGFISHKVLDSIEWGHESSTHEFKKCVRATLLSGQAVELPLDTRFIAAKWVVTDGAIQDDQTPLWKLESRLDKGLVIAFVYDLDEEGAPQPWKPRAADLEGREAARETSRSKRTRAEPPSAPKQKQAPAPNEEQAPEESPYLFASYTPEPEPEATGSEPWGKRVRKGDLMPRGAAESVVSGQIPSVQAAELGPGRILVVLSLTLCRENDDFFPGNVFGMARFYPHVMLMSSVPLLKMEASVRYNRPLRTTIADPPDGLPGAKPTCHGSFDVSNGFISSIMVADANDSADDLGVSSVFVGKNRPLPFWSHLFSYYLPNTYDEIGSEAMRVVRTDRRDFRVLLRTVIRDVEQGNFNYELLQKDPRQGEFDNLHMAPTLRLSGATHVVLHVPFLPKLFDTHIDIDDPSAHEHLKLTNISMAPFCVHDCLHTHWRWGRHLTTKAVLGWNENGPNAVAGAPMVPVNQDVSIWMRSPCQMTYHAWAGSEDGFAKEIPPAEWQVIMHHGSSYAVYVSGDIKNFLAQMGIAALHEGAYFRGLDALDEQRGLYDLTSLVSHAVLYWHLRYVLEKAEDVTIARHWRDLKVRERTSIRSMFDARRF